MAESYKITIKGPNVSVDREITEVEAKQFLVALFSGRPPSPPSEHHTDGPAHRTMDEPDGASLATFVNSANAKSAPEKITAIGVFLHKHQNTNAFNRAALEQAFSEAAEAVPQNLPRDLKRAVKSGWIAGKPGERGVFYVTGSGKQAVSSGFQDNPRRRAAKARHRAKRTRRS